MKPFPPVAERLPVPSRLPSPVAERLPVPSRPPSPVAERLPVPSRLPTLIAALFLALLSPLKATSLLELGEGDFLRGSLLSMDSARLTWLHEFSGTRLTIPLADARRVLFSSAPPATPGGDILLLDNGDILSGTFESLDDTTANLASPDFGRITIPRARIRAARLATGATNVVLAETGDMKLWQANSTSGTPLAWTGNNGVLVFNGENTAETIARDARLPPAADVSFQLAWDPDPMRQPQCVIHLCADTAKPDASSNHYTLNFTRNMLTGQRVGGTKGPRQSVLGRVQLSQHLAGKTSLRFRIVINRPGRKLFVFVNDRLAATWNDDVDTPPAGTHIHISGYPSMPVRLRQLRVESWNGIIGDSLEAGKSGGDQDLVVLNRDGDEAYGRITGIREDKSAGRVVDVFLSIDKLNKLTIPVSKIRHLAFAAKEPPPPPPAGPLSVIRLTDGTKLTGAPGAFDGKSLAFTYLGGRPLSLPSQKLIALDFAGSTDTDPAANGESLEMPPDELEE